MTIMSLMLSGALMVLFNSSRLTSEMRQCLYDLTYDDLKFWIGLVIVASIFLILFTLTANFTAWGIVSSISKSNSHCILRSSIGQYAAQLPSQLLVSAMYSFLIWIALWVFEMMPLSIAIPFTVVMASIFLHIVSVYSELGRLIIHTGAMGQKKIFNDAFEQALLPSGLTSTLISKAVDSPHKRFTATAYYRGSGFNKSNFATQSSLPGVAEAPGDSKTTESQTQPPTTAKPWGESSLGESVRIRNTVHAMFGSEALFPSSDSENPTHTGQLTKSSSTTSAGTPLELGLSDLSGHSEGSEMKPGTVVSGHRPPDSSMIGGGVRFRPPLIRRRNKRQSRRSRAEWEHESVARMMYGAPPVAIDGADDDHDDENMIPTAHMQHADDRAVRRASRINTAAVGALSKRFLWQSSIGSQTSRDTPPAALLSVSEERSFEEEGSTPEKRGLLQDAVEKGPSYN
eukprot:CAMPEP_0113529804 /NCGR_PEP_ID=MMETSP0015_2-20120614/2591_1 /TAXON_ID=2838 /ORGANISM="Odontella" /LENGTH=456 /DNA_ID=CAMNT_0000428463 /DNA_START=364 /DNA_END=1734 /DNA_ORIENTATION=+ /assembly_acc=CAM_ASM_000160